MATAEERGKWKELTSQDKEKKHPSGIDCNPLGTRGRREVPDLR